MRRFACWFLVLLAGVACAVLLVGLSWLVGKGVEWLTGNWMIGAAASMLDILTTMALYMAWSGTPSGRQATLRFGRWLESLNT